MVLSPLFMAMTSLFLLAAFAFEFMSATRTSVPAIYVFGDSLVDVGNNNYILDAPVDFRADFPNNGIDFPGKIPTGRFSNGYVGVDFIAQAMGFKQSPPPFLSLTIGGRGEIALRGVNFASGGSGILDSTGPKVISLTAQIANFESVRSMLVSKLGKKEALLHLSKSLFVICSGSNDLFAYYAEFGFQGNATKDNLFVSSLALKLEDDLKILYKLGARKFGIFGLSLAGCIPALRSTNPKGECTEGINDLALKFNKVAKARLPLLSSKLSKLRYSYANFYEFVSFLQSNALSYGIKELYRACCGAGSFNGESGCTPEAPYCDNREEYYYWDRFHPTQKIYQVVTMAAYNGSEEFSTPINIIQLIEPSNQQVAASSLIF